MSESLQISREGRFLHLALNRPERRNALNMDLCNALGAALEEAEQDPRVGAVLLSGNGKSFCAGMDLHEVLSPGGGDINEAHERIFTSGIRMTKPLIAAVHGAALAGGTGLVANCHVVVAAEDATFGLTEIRIGLWPFVIFRTIAAALGQRRATELALTGRIFAAAEAREYGLVHHIVEPAVLMQRAQEDRRVCRRSQPHCDPRRPGLRARRGGQELGRSRRSGAPHAQRGFSQRRLSGRHPGVSRKALAALAICLLSGRAPAHAVHVIGHVVARVVARHDVEARAG